MELAVLMRGMLEKWQRPLRIISVAGEDTCKELDMIYSHGALRKGSKSDLILLICVITCVLLHIFLSKLASKADIW